MWRFVRSRWAGARSKLLDFSKHTYEAMKKAALGRRKDEPDDDPE